MTSLTVVIPAKNEEALLPRLLRSIARQTVEPTAVIVADAGSTDQTRQIARAFGAKVVEGGLPGPGRNAGAALAKTDLVFFLDADVELTDPMFFEHAMREFHEKGFDIATADAEPINGNRFDRFAHRVYNRYVRLWGDRHPHAPGFCMLVRKDVHEAIGGFDESVIFCEDHDYAVRAGAVGTFGFLTSPVPVSTRRLDRDGRLTIAVKYVLAELHILLIGPIRSNVFHYTFEYRGLYGKKK